MSPCRLLRPVAGLAVVLMGWPSAAAAQAPAVPTTWADGPSRTWKRVATAHHAAVGDADERYLRDALADLESLHAMVRRWMPNATRQGADVTAVVFRDASDRTFFFRMDGEGRPLTWTLSYYQSGRAGDHIVFAVDPIERRERLSVPFMAYGRRFVFGNASPNLPSWVWQGMSQLTAGLPIDHINRDRVVGRPLPSLVKHLQGATLYPLADLIDPMRSQTLSQKGAPLFMAQTWAFVHYLLLGREGRSPEQLMEYIDAIRQGRPSAEAFAAAFGANAADLQADLERYVREGAYPTEPLEVPSVADVAAVPMRESEVEALQGELFVHMSNYAEAEPVLTRALERDPSSRRARMALADHRINHRRFQEAAVLLEPVVAGTPDDFNVTMLLATSLRESKQYEKAYEMYSRAVKLSPSAPGAWMDLSVTAAALNRDAESKAALDAVYRLRTTPGVYFQRGIEMFTLGRDADVLRDMDECFGSPSCSPNDLSYAAFIGALSARRLGRPEKADAYLAAAAKAASLDVWRAAVHAYLAGTSTADDFLNRGRHNGEHTEAHFYLGVTAAIAGRLDDAVRHLQWIEQRGARQYVEYRMGLAELERLQPPRTDR